MRGTRKKRKSILSFLEIMFFSCNPLKFFNSREGEKGKKEKKQQAKNIRKKKESTKTQT
jgi:hypothetical protein